MSILTYNDQVIEQRQTDNYVNLSQMAKANNVLVGDFNATEFAKKYLKALQESIYGDFPLLVTQGFGAAKATWGHPLVAIAFGQWISPEFHVWCNIHIQTLIIQDTIVTFKPNVPLSEIEEYLKLAESVYGESYKQRLFPICVKKFHPYLPVIDAEPAEKASLPTKALLNPTQIASVLGFYYKTGNPNPQKVNKLLEELGYQTNIAGRWSATEKAEGLCDRKPVETNSRTQKDQLLWTDDIIDVLKSVTEE